MKIISLEASNILRLEAIQIQCDGKNVTLSGANTTGKTTVLRCIAMALGGKDEIPDEPIHKGAKKGKIDIDLGEFKVTRTFTQGGGGTLTVSAKDGSRYPSPQAILDGLVGQLTFDPLAFTRLDSKKQAETLRSLVGLDFTAIDREAKEVYDKRTVVNRDIASKESLLSSQAHFPDAPAEESTSADVVKELTEANSHNAKKSELDRVAVNFDEDWKKCVTNRERIQSRIRETRELLAKLETDLHEARDAETLADESANAAQAAVDSFRTIDTAILQGKLTNLEETNRKVRQNKSVRVIKEALLKVTKEADSYTDRLDELAEEKKSMLEAAKMPVPGLSFTDAGVLYKDFPFDQASAAEQLRVSAAMGMVLNPKLRVLMIRDASLLDADSLAVLNDLAAKEDFQLWLEVVSAGKEVSVVIEEGAAK